MGWGGVGPSEKGEVGFGLWIGFGIGVVLLLRGSVWFLLHKDHFCNYLKVRG